VYLSDEEGGSRKDVVLVLIERIDALIKALEETKGLQLYSSSLLVVYDGERGKGSVDLRLIDFAHSYWQGGQADGGVLFGLENLRGILAGFLYLV
jgi:hypothetical protein